MKYSHHQTKYTGKWVWLRTYQHPCICNFCVYLLRCLLILSRVQPFMKPKCSVGQNIHFGTLFAKIVLILSFVYAWLLGFLPFLCFHMIQYLFLMIYVFIFQVIFTILCCHIVLPFSCPSLLMLCSILRLRVTLCWHGDICTVDRPRRCNVKVTQIVDCSNSVIRPDWYDPQTTPSLIHQNFIVIYEGWNVNSGNYLFTTDTK